MKLGDHEGAPSQGKKKDKAGWQRLVENNSIKEGSSQWPIEAHLTCLRRKPSQPAWILA
jgi:hypothetical protein